MLGEGEGEEATQVGLVCPVDSLLPKEPNIRNTREKVKLAWHTVGSEEVGLFCLFSMVWGYLFLKLEDAMFLLSRIHNL